MSKTFSLQIPFFPGFYESDLMNSDTSYWAIKEELEYLQQDCADEHPEYKMLTEDDLDFRYADYESDVAHDFIEVFEAMSPDIVEKVEFDYIDSPKYYNFRNDELFGKVTLARNWKGVMRQFMKDNKDWLRERIKDDWTSYDGFMSFMSNNFDDQRKDKDEDGWDSDKSWYYFLFKQEDERYISTMIAYMMYRENREIRNELIMNALEDIYAGSYVFITKDAEERMKEMVENGEIQLPDPAQLKIDFEA